MRNFLVISGFWILISCGSEPAEQPKAVEIASVPTIESKTPREAEIAKIEYPACGKIWTGNKLSKCGQKLYRKSLIECQVIGTSDMEGAPALLDEYAGDSWQLRAGRNSIRSVDDRIKYLRSDASTPYFEGFVYALANGTDSIRKVICVIDSKLRLESVS